MVHFVLILGYDKVVREDMDPLCKIPPKPKKLITKLKKMSLLKLSVLPLAGALARNHLVSSIQTPLIFNTSD